MTSNTRKFASSSTRYIFSLNVDYTELDKLYSLSTVSKNFNLNPPKNDTKIDEILGTGTNVSSCTFDFLDPSKKTKRWMVSMKDSIQNVILPNEMKTPIKCWWCHDSFTENPLGCPIKIVSEEPEIKMYYSHSNKKDMKEIQNKNSSFYYLTKGYFCCWECLMAYAQSVRSSPEFHESIQYIYHMYSECGIEGVIVPSPHYSLKQEYGGPLSREEYKSKHNSYIHTNNNYIRMVPFGELYQVISKF